MELHSSIKLTYLGIVCLISMLKCFRDQCLSIGKFYLSIDLTDEVSHTGSDMLLEYGLWDTRVLIEQINHRRLFLIWYSSMGKQILEYWLNRLTIADCFWYNTRVWALEYSSIRLHRRQRFFTYQSNTRVWGKWYSIMCTELKYRFQVCRSSNGWCWWWRTKKKIFSSIHHNQASIN